MYLNWLFDLVVCIEYVIYGSKLFKKCFVDIMKVWILNCLCKGLRLEVFWFCVEKDCCWNGFCIVR